MKSFIKTSILTYTFILAMASCTELIDIKTISAEPQIVVEATIGLNEPPLVRLTKTNSLDAGDRFPTVENALVTLEDNHGRTIILTETSPGYYSTTSNFFGKTGATYQLTVNAGATTINATSTIPSWVRIDSVKVINSIYPGGGPPIDSLQEANFYEIKIKYSDPANETNYYRFLVSVNDRVAKGNNIADDRLTNGNTSERNIIIYDPDLKPGDVFIVEMQCIDKAVYEYFESIGNVNMGGNSSSPANPYSNLKGATLGYFSAHTVERKYITIE